MPDATVADARPSGYAEILRRVLAISGYGLWIWPGVAQLLGLLEGMRWRSLGVPRGVGGEMAVHDVPPARFGAAVFIYALPCAALLLTERFGGGLLAAAVAVPSCLPGRMLEQRVCETALAGELAAAG